MLFRREAIEARKTKLYGEVLIATPIAFKAITAFLTAFIVSVLIFIAIASFARIERVQGAIVPSDGIVKVRSASRGILTDFKVDAGGHVEEGEIVGRIVSDPIATDADSERGARLRSVERKIVSVEARLAQTAELHEVRMASVSRSIEDLEAQIERKSGLLELQQRMLVETRKAYRRAKRASGMKIIRKDDLTTQSVRMINAEKDMENLESEIASLRDELGRTRIRRREIRSENELTQLELKGERESLLGERAILTGETAFNVIAPTAGRVTAVLMSEGFNLDGSRPIFSILPEGSTLEAELYVPSRAIGFVEKGQEVRLLLDAFPYEEFGPQTGIVESITDSVVLPNDQEFLTSGPQQMSEPVYKVTVSLDSLSIEAHGRSFPIQQGMLLNANIILEERSILSWILEPVFAVLGRS
jgi:membrane fusion protein